MKKLLCLGLAMIVGVLFLAGCARIENKAVLVNDNASGLIDRVFYANNYVRGACYDDTVLEDESYPDSRYFVIRSQDDFDNVFAPGVAVDADPEGDILLVYTFTSVYVRPIKLKHLYADGGRIFVELSMERSVFEAGVADACSPFQRYVIIRMLKTDISEFEITVTE